MATLVIVLLLVVCLGVGINSLISAYKIYVKKDYSKIQVNGVDAPKYPEKIAAKVALIDFITGVCYLGFVPVMARIGATNTTIVFSIVLIIVLIVKKKVIASGSAET